MAIDSVNKRASVPGAGRPFLRSNWPDATKGKAWRYSVGNAWYGVEVAQAFNGVQSAINTYVWTGYAGSTPATAGILWNEQCPDDSVWAAAAADDAVWSSVSADDATWTKITVNSIPIKRCS